MKTMSSGWQEVAALAASAAAVVAVIGIIASGRRDSRSVGIDNLWRLIEQWDAPESRMRRALLAREVLGDLNKRHQLFGRCIDVLNTFDLVGYLVRARVVRLRDAWSTFFPWAVSWWFVFEPAMGVEERLNKLVYEDYRRLVRSLLRYEALQMTTLRRVLHIKVRLKTIDRIDVSAFLSAELRLLDRLPPGYSLPAPAVKNLPPRPSAVWRRMLRRLCADPEEVEGPGTVRR